MNPVRRRFRFIHIVHGLSNPFVRGSLRLTVTLCGVVIHSFRCMTLADNSADFTLRKKQFLEFRLLSAGCCSYREWVSLVFCLVFSILAHTYFRMSGGAIPVSKYRSSRLIGFRHLVTALHALFSF